MHDNPLLENGKEIVAGPDVRWSARSQWCVTVSFSQKRDGVRHSQRQVLRLGAIDDLEQTTGITGGDHGSARCFDVVEFPFEKFASHFRLN